MEKILFKCPYCNRELLTTNRGFGIHKGCCKDNPNGKQRKLSLEERQKISERRKKYIAEHGGVWWSSRSNCKRSYAEEWVLKIIQSEVKDQNFIEEYHLHKWFMDFAWPKKQIYIEVDGDQHNWEDRKKKDEEKDNYYLNLGWKVLRLPWRYCYYNTQEAIKNIIDFVDNAKIININWEDPKIIEQAKRENLKAIGKVSSNGKCCPYMLSISEWEERKDKILNSGVDMMKFGWVGKMEKATGFSKRIIENTLLKFPEVFEGKYFRRK